MLRKTRVEERNNVHSVAQRVATAGHLTAEDDCVLQPLVLAHQHSLQTSLRRRQLDRARIQGLEAYVLFKDLSLHANKDLADSALAQCEEQLFQAGIDAKAMKRKLRHNAAGDEQWLNIALSGEPSQDRDAMLEDSFGSMWSKTISGRDFQQHPSTPVGLIESLGTRVNEQRARLSTLRDFQRQVSRRNEELIVPRAPTESPRRTPRKSSMTSPSKSGRKTGPSLLRRTPSPVKRSRTVVERSDSQAELARDSPSKSTHDTVNEAASQLGRLMLDAQPERLEEPQKVTLSPLKRTTSLRQPARSTPLRGRVSPRRKLSDDRNTHQEKTAPSACAEVPASASTPRQPEAAVGTPTLADRAKLSMATASIARQNPPTEPSSKPQHTDTGNTSMQPSPPFPPRSSDKAAFVSLAERTQQTLAHLTDLEGTNPKLRRKNHLRSKSYDTRRPSTYPVNPFSGGVGAEDRVPESMEGLWVVVEGQGQGQGAGEGAKTPPRQITAEDVDADSVFKPRARLRRSPPL